MRREERLAVGGRVLRRDGTPVNWQLVNLSASGVYLEGAPALDAGDEVDLTLWLANEIAAIEVQVVAQVAWVDERRRAEDPAAPVGMGLRFMNPPRRQQQLVRHYLRRCGLSARVVSAGELQVIERSSSTAYDARRDESRQDNRRQDIKHWHVTDRDDLSHDRGPWDDLRKEEASRDPGPTSATAPPAIDPRCSPAAPCPSDRRAGLLTPTPGGLAPPVLSTTTVASGLRAPALPPAPSDSGTAVVPPELFTPHKIREATRRLPPQELKETQILGPPAGVDAVLPAGAVVGSYRVLGVIGSGGMGHVYRAEHMQLSRLVALKTLHRRFSSDAGLVRRFLNEARVVNRIQQENIVEITDFIASEEQHYIVMELLQGDSLAQLLAREGALPIDRVIGIVTQLCAALHAVHLEGIVHRDLKPDNIMLIGRNGTSDFVKLLDFGVAQLRDRGNGRSLNETGVGVALGTAGYMAPEQLLETPTDHRADVYALGVLLYQLITGKTPFVANTWGQLLVKHVYEPPPRPSEIVASLPPSLEALILHCLEKKPRARPQTVAEVSKRLKGFRT